MDCFRNEDGRTVHMTTRIQKNPKDMKRELPSVVVFFFFTVVLFFEKNIGGLISSPPPPILSPFVKEDMYIFLFGKFPG